MTALGIKKPISKTIIVQLVKNIKLFFLSLVLIDCRKAVNIFLKKGIKKKMPITLDNSSRFLKAPVLISNRYRTDRVAKTMVMAYNIFPGFFIR
jgi:hypothetical protein